MKVKEKARRYMDSLITGDMVADVNRGQFVPGEIVGWEAVKECGGVVPARKEAERGVWEALFARYPDHF